MNTTSERIFERLVVEHIASRPDYEARYRALRLNDQSQTAFIADSECGFRNVTLEVMDRLGITHDIGATSERGSSSIYLPRRIADVLTAAANVMLLQPNAGEFVPRDAKAVDSETTAPQVTEAQSQGGMYDPMDEGTKISTAPLGRRISSIVRELRGANTIIVLSSWQRESLVEFFEKRGITGTFFAPTPEQSKWK